MYTVQYNTNILVTFQAVTGSFVRLIAQLRQFQNRDTLPLYRRGFILKKKIAQISTQTKDDKKIRLAASLSRCNRTHFVCSTKKFWQKIFRQYLRTLKIFFKNTLLVTFFLMSACGQKGALILSHRQHNQSMCFFASMTHA